jgi:alcohol dehydrogenase (cytochrome c)
MCTVVVSTPGQTYAPGKMHYGGSWSMPPDPATGWISAFDANTGRLSWKYHADAPILGAVTATAGGLVLSGDNAGNFLVLDSASGKLLKKVETHGSISGGIITYAIGGRQYIAFTSGSISRTGFGALGRPSVLVMAAEQRLAATRSERPDPSRGQEVYQHTCLGCHASDGAGVPGFSLQNIKSRMSREQLIAWIRNPRPPMPRVFAEPLDGDDVQDLSDLAAYLQHGLRELPGR